MKRYIAHRLLQGIVLLCLVGTIVFFLGRLTGNPVDLMLPEDATPEDRAAMIQRLGLDGPLYEQFLIFIVNAVQGDLGMSIRMHQPAVEAFFSRLPNTLAIIPWAILLGTAVGIPLGVVAALNRGNLLDRAAGAVAVMGIAMPSFWLGVLLIFIFSVELGWLPSGRMGGPEHYILPVVTLGAFLVAGFMRLTRSSMLEVMDSEFVKVNKALLDDRDPAKRTVLTDKMVEIVSNSWVVMPLIEGMGYYAINTKKVGQFQAIAGRHELGDVFERMPRPDEKPWKK